MVINLPSPHPEEVHKSQRSNWLRAAVLGVNDGIVSNASLMLGVSAAAASSTATLTAGIAGVVAGALSMAAGEYVSVSSQRDAEREDVAIERRSHAANPEQELAELTKIYELRGLDKELAAKVAHQLHQRGSVEAHVRDELGIDEGNLPSPTQAAIASAIAFTVGGVIPILGAIVASAHFYIVTIVVFSLAALAASGAIGAIIGGGNRFVAALRVLIGGSVAMAITAFIGHLVGLSL